MRKSSAPYTSDNHTSAPRQAPGSLTYSDLTVGEAELIFRALRAGRVNMRLALTFGRQIVDYRADIAMTDSQRRDFNTCAAKTNIYGGPFSIPE